MTDRRYPLRGATRKAMREMLRNDRTKPKWDIVTNDEKTMKAAIDSNDALFMNNPSNYSGWLFGAVFKEGGFDQFMDKLKRMVIQDLWVSDFDFTEPTMHSLCNALDQHQPTGLFFDDCDINDACVELLVNRLPSSLVTFDIKRTKISPKSLVAIAGEVARCSTRPPAAKPFSRLNLCEVKMDDDCFAALCEVLPDIKGLERLDVERNRLTERGLEAFAVVVNRCRTLTKVNFSYNQIASLRALCDPQHTPLVLQELDFLGNHAIGDESARALVDALYPRSSVKYVGLVDTGVGHATQEVIRGKLERQHSPENKALLTLSSARAVPRLAVGEGIQDLPNDLLRLVKQMLQ